MISEKYKCIFVHVIKTGGMSVASALDMKDLNCHVPAKHIKENVGANLWNDYFIFSFVRNPWDKIVSQYFFNGEKFCMKHLGRPADFTEYIVEIVGRDKFYSMYEPRNLPYIVDDKGKQLVDFIGRFENLQKDFDLVCDKIGMPKKVLPKINQSKHDHYTTYYNKKTKNIIAQKFKDDIEYFGYVFDGE